MYIHLLARELRLRNVENPNLGALALCVLSSCTAIGAHEVARGAPAIVITAKRPDDSEQQYAAEGPESAELRTVFVEPQAPAMPPGRGMTYAMQQPEPWPCHVFIQSMATFRNTALLDSIASDQKTAGSDPVN